MKADKAATKGKWLVIELDGVSYVVHKKKDKDMPDIILFGEDICTGLPWPPVGGECPSGFTPYEKNGEICCEFNPG